MSVALESLRTNLFLQYEEECFANVAFLFPDQRRMCKYESQCETGTFTMRAAFISRTYLNVPIAVQNFLPIHAAGVVIPFFLSSVSNYFSHLHSADTI